MDDEEITLDRFQAHMNAGEVCVGGSPIHRYMIHLADEAQKITSQINTGYRSQPELRALMSELFGKEVPESFALFPPFTTDCGKNTVIGENVFINSGCRFQDQG